MTRSTPKASDLAADRPRVLKSRADHAAALRIVETLMVAQPGSPEGQQLDLWVTLVDQYEREHDLIDAPDPIEAIRFRMEQQGLEDRDLVPLIGSRSKVSEVLSRKRPLSLRMIRAIHESLGIPAELLIRRPMADSVH